LLPFLFPFSPSTLNNIKPLDNISKRSRCDEETSSDCYNQAEPVTGRRLIWTGLGCGALKRRCIPFDPSEVGIAKTDPAEISPAEVSPAEIGTTEVGEAEVGEAEVGLAEVSPAEVGPAENGPEEISPEEAGPNEIGPAEVGLTEVDPAEVGPTEVGPDETGPAEVDPVEVGPAEVGVHEVRTNIRVLISPRIPGFDSLSQKTNMPLVSHELISYSLFPY
jgi:hypothetical protein